MLEKQTYFLWAVCFSAVCVSCVGRHTAELPADAIGVIQIDVTRDRLKAEEFALDKAVSELEYIPLETTKNCLVSRLHNVYMIGDNLLVNDMFNLYIFDRQGKFIRPVGRRGQGPSDYEYVQTVIVDSDSRV
ncbi:MAG: 6-bladed beta-propeller, partial [Tannerella sp.]|nr:6-bladed beta-propeller [Tannerella sp.]